MPRGHILVLDDEPSILTTLQKALTLEGYAVDVAGGVKIAEEKLAKRTYDLALFDVALPVLFSIASASGLSSSSNARSAPVIALCTSV